MRSIPPALDTQLQSGVTTLCHCWILTRRDAVMPGFTDHDRDVVVAGVTCRASSALTPGQHDNAMGLAAGTTHISGALDSETLTAEDMDAGLYDRAQVAVYRVDWTTSADAVLLSTSTIQHIQRTDHGFSADLAGPLADFDQITGRVFGRMCDATLGDARCGVDVEASGLNATGSITRLLGPGRYEVSGLAAFAPGFFSAGWLTFTTGALSGQSWEIMGHSGDSGAHVVTLRTPLAIAPAVGDSIHVRAGCDQQFSTCNARFGNAVNFRGCPHLPGEDFVLGYPTEGEQHDGGSRFGA